MGTSRSAGELSRKLRGAAGAIEGAARDGVGKSALMVKKSVQAELVRVGVRGGRLRGVGKKGARIGVRYDVKGTKNPTALVRATGPFHLIERGTKPHTITPKKKGGAINIAGTGPRRFAKHPGTRGKHPWAKGVNRVLPLVPKVMAREQSASLNRYFG
jgi:hypothetical protein